MTAIRLFFAWMSMTVLSLMILFIGTTLSGKIIAAFPANFNSLGYALPQILFLLIGFTGVLAGSLFLKPPSRLAGSIVLTILGILTATGFWFVGISFVSIGPAGMKPMYWMEISLAIGGSINVIFNKLNRPTSP